MTQAQRDKMAAEKNRCPVCHEVGGHRLVNGRDCTNQTAERMLTLSDETKARMLGITVEQLRAGYASTAAKLEKMAAGAAARGLAKVNHIPVETLLAQAHYFKGKSR